MQFGRIRWLVLSVSLYSLGPISVEAQTNFNTFGQQQGAGGFGAQAGGFGGGQTGGFGAQPFGAPQGQGQFNQNQVPAGSADDIRQRQRQLFGNQPQRQSSNFQVDNLLEQSRSRRGGRGRGQDKPGVRVQLKPRFEYTRLSTQAVAANLQTSLVVILQERRVAMPVVEVSERTVTLRGRIIDQEQGDFIEKLVSMEPGVSEVVNLLEVRKPEELLIPSDR